MSSPRVSAIATLLPAGQVLVAGGYYFDFEISDYVQLASAELYDPLAALWSLTDSMNASRSFGPTATLLPGGVVLAAGGKIHNGSPVSAELYGPVVTTATPTPTEPRPRSAHRRRRPRTRQPAP